MTVGPVTANGNYISLTSPLSVPERATFTATMWFYSVAQSTSYAVPIEFGAFAGACAQIYTTRIDASNFKFSLWDGTNFDESSDPNRQHAIWYHLALRRESGILTLFVNGVRTVALGANAITPGTAWRILNQSDNTLYTNGRVSGVKYYAGIPLTASQIAADMRQQYPVTPRPTGFYPFIGDANTLGVGITGSFATTGTVPLSAEGPAIPWRLGKEHRNKRYGDVFGGGPPPTNRRRRVLLGAA